MHGPAVHEHIRKELPYLKASVKRMQGKQSNDVITGIYISYVKLGD
jgi:hypothetical protein